MKDEHDLVMTTEQEQELAQSITDKVDDAMLFDYDMVLTTIADSDRCKEAIMCLCLMSDKPFAEQSSYHVSMKAMYANDLVKAIADDMRQYFE